MDQKGLEPVEVIARFDIEGRLHPIQFVWHDTQFPVASTGRRWVDETAQHVLVMDHQARVFELVFMINEQRWYLKKTSFNQKIILPT